MTDGPRQRWVDVAAQAALMPGQMLEAEAGVDAVLLYNVSGTLYATSAICPHHAAWLSQGAVHGDHVDCPRHGGQFHIPTGRLTRGPACPDLRTYRVQAVAGRIQVAVAG